MRHSREFEIAFVGLKPGVHVFEYRVDDQFFQQYGPQEFNQCSAKLTLSLDKKNGFMQLKFDVDGQVASGCDRCGNPLVFQLWEEFHLLVKLVEDPAAMNEQEEDPDVFYISRGESHLHVQDWIYEFVQLSIPAQKMCKPEEYGGAKCNLEALALLKKMEEEARQSTGNPAWKGLDQFKNLEE
ncbi:MAG: DUF177 domain-containing protein [Sphingobacteriia bacterium]|nr:MAG: DUF177 domain-containing protein [Sphingobacteriia bacterium]